MSGASVSRTVALALVVLILVFSAIAIAWSPGRVAETVVARRHIAVTANPHASEAARTILRAGGSAVDAAIAAQLVLTLVEPQSSGIGGGLFMLVSDSKRQLRVFDGREAAPGNASPKMFLDASGKARSFNDIATGGLAVGVPGAIAALWQAHQAHGRLPWKAVFQPAIELSEKGFRVTPILAHAISELQVDELNPAMQALYFRADGTHVRAGDRIRDPDLAKTLRLIAEKGPAGFYDGEVAQAIVAAVRSSRRNPGVMTLEDLASYRAVESPSLCRPYRAYRVCTAPLPSGGLTVLQILGILQTMPPAHLRPNSVFQAHLLSQASRLAFADRARWLGDPAAVQVPTEGLLDRAYLSVRAKDIESAKDMGTATAGKPSAPGAHLPDYAPQRTQVGHGTSHLAIVDERGMVVSMTMSIQASFGSQVRAAGIVLNNELTDFSTEPAVEGRSVANAPAPGKRPLSAMSPAIVFDERGGFFAAIGSPGGPDIIAFNVRALSDLIDGRTSVAQAVSNPHVVNLNGPTYLEKRFSSLWIGPALMAKGHTVRFRELQSGLNGILKTGDRYEGASDIRGEGGARGD